MDILHDTRLGRILRRFVIRLLLLANSPTDFSPHDRAAGRLFQIALIILFPVVVMAIQLGFLLRLDAAQPVDSLNCDASSPTWSVKY